MRGHPGRVARAVQGLTHGWDDGRSLARQICQACVDGLDVDGAAISVLTATISRETLWASDATAERLEDLQFTLNEGACMQAAGSGIAVSVLDVQDRSATTSWPVFAAAVAEQTAVRALFALPLQWGEVNLGVLDLYRSSPGGLPPDQWEDAIAAADAAAVMLLEHRTDPAGQMAGVHRDGRLRHGDSGHAEIHQATGMVLAQLGSSAADALARMRAYSYVHQRLLVDVSRDVIDRSLVFAGDPT